MGLVERSLSSRPRFAFAAGLAVVAALAACGTSNGGVEENAPSAPPERKPAAVDPVDRPAFDASLPDDDAGAGDGGVGEAGTCDDPNDHGGAPNVAFALPNTDDCDNSTKSARGVINGGADADWFKFVAADKTGCSIDNAFGTQTAGVELCVWVSCFTGATSLSGCQGGTRTKNPTTNEDGCCFKGPGNVVPQYDCPGLTDDDSATFFVRLRSAGANACIPYTWTYKY